jgi:hypothetical protein
MPAPVNNTAAADCKSREPFYKTSFCYVEVATEQLFVNIIIILVAARILGEFLILCSLGASVKRKNKYKLASIQDRHIAYKIRAGR